MSIYDLPTTPAGRDLLEVFQAPEEHGIAGRANNAKTLYLRNTHLLVKLRGVSFILEQLRGAIRVSEKSRYRLSKETGIAQSQLSRLMTGREGLSFQNLEKLVAALGLEIIFLPTGSKANKKKG